MNQNKFADFRSSGKEMLSNGDADNSFEMETLNKYVLKEKNPFKWHLSVLFGFLFVLTEVVFTSIALLFWPADQSGGFNLFKNWHSDLGSRLPGFNTIEGSVYHNAGLIIQGVALIIFTGGLYISSIDREQNKQFFHLAQIFGVLMGFAILMAGIYSLDLRESHKFWASGIFITALPFVGLLSYLFYKESGFKKWIGRFGFSVLALDALFALSFISPIELFILEYVVLHGLHIFILLVTLDLFINNELIQVQSLKLDQLDQYFTISRKKFN